MNYDGKVVLVTGGANGIGKVISQAYLKSGATVIIADIDEEKGKALQAEYTSKSDRAFFYKIDLQNVVAIRELFQTIISMQQSIDILINNAGKGNFRSLYELTIEEWDEVINLNLRAAFIAAQEFARYNRGTSYGRIINISSTRYLMSEANTEPMSFIVSPDHHFARQSVFDLADLATEDFIVTQSGCAYREYIERLLEKNDIHPRSFMKVKNIEAIKQFVISGLGLAILPRVYIEKELRHNQLIELPWTGPDFGMYTQIIYHKDKWLSPILLSFLELTRSKF